METAHEVALLAPPREPAVLLSHQAIEHLPIASLEPRADYRVELVMPSHRGAPFEPQHLYSGRKIRLVADNTSSKAALPTSGALALVQREPQNGAAVNIQALPIEASRHGLVVPLPQDLPSGRYTLDIPRGREIDAVPLEIRGLDHRAPERKVPPRETPGGATHPRLPQVTSIQRLGCSSCYWELAMVMSREDPQVGYLVGSDQVIRTANSWRQWSLHPIDEVTQPNIGNYLGDPELAFLEDGRVALVGLVGLRPGLVSGALYLDRSAPGGLPDFEQVILRSEHDQVQPQDFLIFDFPKIAVDRSAASPYFGSTYIPANAVLFPDGTRGTGFYILRDGILEEHKALDLGFRQPPQSILITPEGSIYLGRSQGGSTGDSFGRVVEIYISLDGGASFEGRRIFEQYYVGGHCTGRLSPRSQRYWGIDPGPELALDPTSNRLYAAWSHPKHCIPDPDFEFPSYGFDWDVKVSFSDDGGQTWSEPVRANDGPVGVDQGFADIEVDDQGQVWVAYLDRRDTQDVEAFDVYLTRSLNRGQTFESSVRINDVTVPNAFGGRNPGDYLDTLGFGDDVVHAAHPCVAVDGGSDQPNETCVATLIRPDDDCPLSTGHEDYCRDCGPCGHGEGDCDASSECTASTTCRENAGVDFGLAPNIDVCARDTPLTDCELPAGHPNYCLECGPCGFSEGNCANDSQCLAGNHCAEDIGAQFGFGAEANACVPSQPTASWP